MSLKLHTPKKYVYIVLLMKEWKKNKKKNSLSIQPLCCQKIDEKIDTTVVFVHVNDAHTAGSLA